MYTIVCNSFKSFCFEQGFEFASRCICTACLVYKYLLRSYLGKFLNKRFVLVIWYSDETFQILSCLESSLEFAESLEQ